MIKGQTKIELVDVNTNEKKTYTDNNMVTNAIPNLFKSMSTILDLDKFAPQCSMLPLNSKGMGGIALFNTTLEEDSNNISLPLENKVVAIASSGVYEGDSPRHGSKNMIESGKIDNGYKYVWDFETSQGNGEIKSLGLIHSNAGSYYKLLDDNPTGSIVPEALVKITSDTDINASTVENWDTEYPYIAYFNAKTGIIYCINTTSAHTVLITTYKLFTGFNNLGINDSMGSIKFLEKKELTTSLNMIPNTSWTYSEEDGYFYGFGGLKGSPSNATIVRIKFDDLTFDESFIKEYSFTIPDKKGLTWVKSYTSLCVHNNRLYAYSQGSSVIMYFDLTDTSKVELRSISLGALSTLKVFNNLIHCGPVYFSLDFINNGTRYVKGKSVVSSFFPKSNMENAVYISPEGACVGFEYQKSYSRIYLMYGIIYDYLATINNLNTPVIKTSAQTMKITYTITESD